MLTFTFPIEIATPKSLLALSLPSAVRTLYAQDFILSLTDAGKSILVFFDQWKRCPCRVPALRSILQGSVRIRQPV